MVELAANSFNHKFFALEHAMPHLFSLCTHTNLSVAIQLFSLIPTGIRTCILYTDLSVH